MICAIFAPRISFWKAKITLTAVVNRKQIKAGFAFIEVVSLSEKVNNDKK